MYIQEMKKHFCLKYMIFQEKKLGKNVRLTNLSSLLTKYFKPKEEDEGERERESYIQIAVGIGIKVEAERDATKARQSRNGSSISSVSSNETH